MGKDGYGLKIRFIAVFLLGLLSSGWLNHAQEASLTIAADNIRQLHSVAHIDFADHGSEAGKIENGWFTMSAAADRMAVINRESELVVWDEQGSVIDRYAIPGSDGLPTTVLDADFSAEGAVLVSAHAEGGAFYVAYGYVGVQQAEYFRFPTADVPLRIWADATSLQNTWLEVSPADYLKGRYVLQLKPNVMNRFRTNEVLTEDELMELPSGPENDVNAYLRIGRIDPPDAITVTQDFLVKHWNLETGEVVATAQLDALPGAGQLTPDGRYFGWRDGDSQALHLLDFESGHDRVIAPLQGTYIPFLLLSVTGDVMIGVNVGLEPTVVAWDTVTGERIELGKYRDCNRQPDMVRLNTDGTTLVIGCDSGLDMWRVQ